MKGGHEVAFGRRINMVLLFFYLACFGLVSRLFLVQIVHHGDYVRLAAKQHRVVLANAGERGIIYAQDKSGNRIPLTINTIEKNLIVSPKNVKDPKAVVDFASARFNLDSGEVEAKLSQKDDPYEILVKHVDPEYADTLISELPKGVSFEEEKQRAYPHGQLAADLLGFVAKEQNEDKGKYGLERFYNNELIGKQDFLDTSSSSTAGFWNTLTNRIIHPPANGSAVITTIDYNIQTKAEEILKASIVKWQATSGSLVVMNPATGAILAIAGYPQFDPNEFSKEKNYSLFLNSAIESQYELGSVMKPVTMAAGIEEEKVNPNTTYTDSGEIKVSGYIIKNFDGKAYGVQTMTQVLEKSLNTGAVYVARLLGRKLEQDYFVRFGFGVKTGVDLPGEVSGDISSLNINKGSEIDFDTASFGQGIAVTPLQMAYAIGAIANGGKLMKPYVVERIIDDSGNERKTDSSVVRQVVSQKTAETVSRMLVSVVNNGFEDRAGVKGYFVAGKTGTAQISQHGGKGYSDAVIHTFIGYAPAFQPKFLALLQMNEPKGNRFAANTLTPAFHDLAEYILNYYEVPPDESR